MSVRRNHPQLTSSSQHRTFSFDHRSLMLFTALALGGAAAVGSAHAQSGPSSASMPGTTTGKPPVSAAAPAGPVMRTPLSNATASMAFDRADANHDGKLSAQEAAQLPAIGQRFKELDTDRNGSLSRTEFEKGANS